MLYVILVLCVSFILIIISMTYIHCWIRTHLRRIVEGNTEQPHSTNTNSIPITSNVMPITIAEPVVNPIYRQNDLNDVDTPTIIIVD